MTVVDNELERLQKHKGLVLVFTYALDQSNAGLGSNPAREEQAREEQAT